MAKRYVWLTDTHFDFLSKSKLLKFFVLLRELECDGIFISGDVSTGNELADHISFLLKVTEIPIYWVNGNHDYYGSNFAEINETMMTLMEDDERLHYLTSLNYLPLGKTAALIGHDGWCDSRWRVPYTSFLFYADFVNIEDFRKLKNNKERMNLVRQLADTAAASIATKLLLALQKFDTVYLLTHFPPWPDKTNKYWGLLEEFWKPYNSSKVMADTLEGIMTQYPDKKLVVLSGHTHNKRNVNLTPNIELRVGSANLMSTEVQDILFIE